MCITAYNNPFSTVVNLQVVTENKILLATSLKEVSEKVNNVKAAVSVTFKTC